MSERPRGTVTFLFTDVEGSTRLLKQLRESYGAALAEHARLLREASPPTAARRWTRRETRSSTSSRALATPPLRPPTVSARSRGTTWPEGAEFRVRMGLHTGEPDLSDEGRYHGMGVHRTARIMAAGHGGQVLASQSTASVLADDELDGHHAARPRRAQAQGPRQPGADLRAPDRRAAEPTSRRSKTESAAAAPTPLYRRPLVIGSLAGVVAAAIAIPVFAFGGGSRRKLAPGP